MFWIAAVCIGLGAGLILPMPAASSRPASCLLAEPLGTILLALGYGAAIIGIADLPQGEGSRLGRADRTDGLHQLSAQSIIPGWIFYGYGLGLFGKLGVTSALTIGLAVYVLQVPFSAGGFAATAYGPVEWLWRTLMYGKAQPMRKAA